MFLNRSQFKRSLRSIALVETAFSLLAFMAIVYGVIKFGYLMYAKQTLGHAVREGGRIATTGRILYPDDLMNNQTNWPTYTFTNTNSGSILKVLADYTTPSRPMSRQQTIVEIVKRNLATLQDATNSSYMSIVNWEVTNNATVGSTNNEANPSLGPGERSDENYYRYVRIRIDYPVPLLTGVGTVTLRAETVVVNDAWGFTNTARWGGWP